MKTFRYITAVAAIIALAACQQEQTDGGGFADDPNAVRITATVDDNLTRSNPIAADQSDRESFNHGDRISIRTSSTSTQAPVVYTLTNGTWMPEAGKYLKWTADKEFFEAYYPVGGHYDGSDTFEVPTDQYTPDLLADADYMRFWGEKEKQDGALSLTLTRETARIVISEFMWQPQFDRANCKIESVTISDGTTHVNAYVENDSKCYALLHPTDNELTGNTFMVITVKDEVKNEQTRLTISDIPAHKAGYSYSYRIILGRRAATIGAVTVESWQTGEVIKDGGETTEAPDYTTSEADGVTTYHVYTAQGLQDVNAILTASGVTAATLASNITLEGNITLPAVAEGGSNWTPIGIYTEDESGNAATDLGYTGTFDGNGYTITGLVIHSGNNYQGLFGFLDTGGVIKDLTLANCSVEGGRHTAAFVGWSNNSSIENCHLIATTGKEVRIESESYYIGGIVGQSFGTVSGCSLTANGGSVTIASTDDHVGGIVGNAGRASYTSGCQVLALNGGAIAITGNERTGGIVGNVVNGDNAEMMSDCHVTNNGGTITVTGAKDVGGAVGYIHSISNSFVQDCHVTGVQVTGTAQVGGFTGRLNDESTIVGSNTVKDCTVTGTDAATVKWDVGKNNNTSHTPEITDGGGNILNGTPTK